MLEHSADRSAESSAGALLANIWPRQESGGSSLLAPRSWSCDYPWQVQNALLKRCCLQQLPTVALRLWWEIAPGHSLQNVFRSCNEFLSPPSPTSSEVVKWVLEWEDARKACQKCIQLPVWSAPGPRHWLRLLLKWSSICRWSLPNGQALS